MASLYPGYSLGDIISGIKWIAQVLSTLKEKGGASSDYQQIIRDVNRLEYILQEIKNTPPTETNASHVHFICPTTNELKTTLEEFLDSTSKYNEALGPQWRRSEGIPRKLQWQVVESPKVKALQSKIAFQFLIIEMLYQLLLA
jgi:hypothetical protein